jgi:hypothetical protein
MSVHLLAGIRDMAGIAGLERNTNFPASQLIIEFQISVHVLAGIRDITGIARLTFRGRTFIIASLLPHPIPPPATRDKDHPLINNV